MRLKIYSIFIFLALAGSLIIANQSAAQQRSCNPYCAKIINGKAIISRFAPQELKAMIAAGNRIHRRPYVYGGGHRSFRSRGYDCSGAVSYLLRAAGKLHNPLDSSSLMRFGRAGHGKWVTVYSKPSHAFIVVAGLRFDTSYITDGDHSGPGWSRKMRPKRGFIARHFNISTTRTVNSGGIRPGPRARAASKPTSIR